jgi:hypothetical protein
VIKILQILFPIDQSNPFFFSFHLGYCVIGSHNTGYGDEKTVKKYPRPKIYGVALDVETGDIFPADFPDDSKGHSICIRTVNF